MDTLPALAGSQTILVWDDDGPPPQGPWIPVMWRGFAVAAAAESHSIPKLIEQHAASLRTRFLAWVYELGETRIGGRRVVDHLALRPGFSFWWTTLLVEKGNAFNSPQVTSVIKLLALEDLLREREMRGIVLVSSDAALAAVLRLWGRARGLPLEWRRTPARRARETLLLRAYRRLPQPMQAVLALLHHLIARRKFRMAGTAALAGSAARITLCSYLFNLAPSSAGSGYLRTSYWATLHDMLDRDPRGVNWLLLFIKHHEVPTAQAGQRLVASLNQRAAGVGAYAVLDGTLGWTVMRRTLRDYLRVALAAWRLRGARRHFTPESSCLDLWPLLSRDWACSLWGAAAIRNCLYLNLFEQTLACLPRQALGLYLQENISWEMAFVHAWKALGHGELIGVPHSTVRYWDLRYFFDPRSFRRTGANDLPLPDKVALNGPAAIEAYVEGGFPPERIREVEALRYLHLAGRTARRRAKAGPTTPLRVLVLGDYMAGATAHQMQLLAQAAPALPADTHIVVKPHPACPIKRSRYPAVSFQLATDSLERLVEDCDVAYTGNATSAAVDAHSQGVPVVTVLDGTGLNVSPLRGVGGVTFVTTPGELAAALKAARETVVPTGSEYFFLDSALPRWQQLLGLAQPEKRDVERNSA